MVCPIIGFSSWQESGFQKDVKTVLVGRSYAGNLLLFKLKGNRAFGRAKTQGMIEGF